MTAMAESRHPHARPGSIARESARRYCRIGEAARTVGVSASALRRWEREGLIGPARSAGRYRLYSDEDLDVLRRVRRMRQERVNAPGIIRLLSTRTVTAPAAQRQRQGARLRALREARGMSLRDAAAAAGLSVSFLSAVELGTSGTSVASLQRVTSAYGTTLGELFAQHRSPRRVVHATRRSVIGLGEDAVRIEQLAESASLLEPQLFRLAPGASSEGTYHHAGEEFMYVLAGSVTVWVGDSEHYRLDEGDALTFPSTLPHRWRNHATRETRLLWINTPPTF
jgi:DNA-binding transcriptional MerR regulator/quercetin dioxygenase-like cupin family protein